MRQHAGRQKLTASALPEAQIHYFYRKPALFLYHQIKNNVFTYPGRLLACFFFLALMYCLHHDDCAVWVKENETRLFFYGRVTRKFKDPQERYQAAVVLDDSLQYRLRNQDIYDWIKPGDLLYKEPGSLKRYLVKGQDTTVFYSRCGKQNVE